MKLSPSGRLRAGAIRPTNQFHRFTQLSGIFATALCGDVAPGVTDGAEAPTPAYSDGPRLGFFLASSSRMRETMLSSPSPLRRRPCSCFGVGGSSWERCSSCDFCMRSVVRLTRNLCASGEACWCGGVDSHAPADSSVACLHGVALQAQLRASSYSRALLRHHHRPRSRACDRPWRRTSRPGHAAASTRPAIRAAARAAPARRSARYR